MIRTVLCPTDFTPLSERAVSLAARLSARWGARLVLEHNLDPQPPTFLSVEWMWSEDHESAAGAKALEAEARLLAAVQRLGPELSCEARLTRGPMDLGLAALARALPADLLVMGSHAGGSVDHRSLTERLLDTAPCPVLTLSEASTCDAFPDAADAPCPVLVPLDLTPHSRRTAAHALELLDLAPLALHFLHVEAGPFEPAYVGDCSRLEALVPEARRGQVSFHIRSGNRTDQILAAARELDARLILMGCHGKGALERLLTGATAREILHRAACPVWFEPAA